MSQFTLATLIAINHKRPDAQSDWAQYIAKNAGSLNRADRLEPLGLLKDISRGTSILFTLPATWPEDQLQDFHKILNYEFSDFADSSKLLDRLKIILILNKIFSQGLAKFKDAQEAIDSLLKMTQFEMSKLQQYESFAQDHILFNKNILEDNDFDIRLRTLLCYFCQPIFNDFIDEGLIKPINHYNKYLTYLPNMDQVRKALIIDEEKKSCKFYAKLSGGQLMYTDSKGRTDINGIVTLNEKDISIHFNAGLNLQTEVLPSYDALIKLREKNAENSVQLEQGFKFKSANLQGIASQDFKKLITDNDASTLMANYYPKKSKLTIVTLVGIIVLGLILGPFVIGGTLYALLGVAALVAFKTGGVFALTGIASGALVGGIKGANKNRKEITVAINGAALNEDIMPNNSEKPSSSPNNASPAVVKSAEVNVTSLLAARTLTPTKAIIAVWNDPEGILPTQLFIEIINNNQYQLYTYSNYELIIDKRKLIAQDQKGYIIQKSEHLAKFLHNKQQAYSSVEEKECDNNADLLQLIQSIKDKKQGNIEIADIIKQYGFKSDITNAKHEESDDDISGRPGP
jgi:hypothetical protein